MTDQIGVIGAGAWGTTLAVKLAAAERPVTLWAHTLVANQELATVRENRHYLPGIVFPPNLRVAIHHDPDLARGYEIPDKRATVTLLGGWLARNAE